MMTDSRFIRYIIYFCLPLLTLFCSVHPENFDELLEIIEETTSVNKSEILSNYIELKQEFPEKKDTTAYFLYESESGKDVFLTGDMCSWKPDSLPMKNIDGTNFYFIKQNFPKDARLEYKLFENGQAVFDPLNPLRDGGPVSQNTVLFMPEYRFSKYILLNKENAISTIDTIKFKSTKLKNTREVLIYIPETNQKINNIILFNDGPEYIQYANAQIILDNLISEKQIPPVYGVFIPPVNRMQEYWLNEAYITMIFKELLPLVRKKYQLDQSLKTGMGGASLGGVISLFALAKYQDDLDFVFSQSGALQISKGQIIKEFSAINGIQSKIYLDYGFFEGTEKYHQEMTNYFKQQDIQYQLRKINEGHNWGNWRGNLPEALIFCLSDEGK